MINKLSFGISSVNESAKMSSNISAPQIIARATEGSFTLTSGGAKTLSIAPGEYIMFFNNISEIERAIMERNEDIIAFAAENGKDIDNKDDVDEIVSNLTCWYVAKGIARFKPNGEPVMCTPRMSKADKKQWLAEHLNELIENHRTDLINKYDLDSNASSEDIANVVGIDDIESPKAQDYKGCKTSSSSSMTGIGAQLNFSSTSIWYQLKNDLENKTSVNRIFDIDVENKMETLENDGCKEVRITVYPISFSSDTEVSRKEKKD